MLNCMNGDIVDAHVDVGFLHAVSVFFHEAKGPFNSGSEHPKLLIDQDDRDEFSLERAQRERKDYIQFCRLQLILNCILVIKYKKSWGFPEF